jgi:deoxycytidylate deaminase
MKEKHLVAYMETAYAFAECSTARRLKVGCIIVKDERIISIGYNGTPSGWDNNCESELYSTDIDENPKTNYQASGSTCGVQCDSQAC